MVDDQINGFAFRVPFPSEVPTTQSISAKIDCVGGTPYRFGGPPLNPVTLTCAANVQGQEIRVSDFTNNYECIGKCFTVRP